MQIDLKKEFNSMISDDHDIILVRHNTTVHCKCWRKETATPDPNCPNCLGGGFIFNEWIKEGKIFKDGDYMAFFTPVDNDSYYIRTGDLLFEIWVDQNGGFLSNPTLGSNILKKSRWIITSVDAPQSGSHVPDFLRINAAIQPSSR